MGGGYGGGMGGGYGSMGGGYGSGMSGSYPMGAGGNMPMGAPAPGVSAVFEPDEPDKVSIGLGYARSRTAKHLHTLEIKAYLREISLSEDEIDEVLRRVGREPEQPQYGVRTKAALDERTAARYRQHEAEQREQARLERVAAEQVFTRATARPPTFFYELKRGYAKAFGDVSAETPTRARSLSCHDCSLCAG